MKILSVILTALLLIPVIFCSVSIFQIYFKANNTTIPGYSAFPLLQPSIVYTFSYFIFFVLSVLLNVRKKFTINIVLSGCLILIFFFTINLIRKTWLG